ncbi:MAG: class I SAM-dependent methyltransferase [Gemmatimonadales bacterium]
MRGLWLRDPGSYEGYRQRSPPGVQEAAIALLGRHLTSRSSVLDLGSGGAMLARLSEIGFRDRHAVARDPSLVGDTDAAVPKEWSVVSLDLGGDFAAHYSRRFDVIVSSELIEHLESPSAFLRQAHALLEDDGFLMVTTPNVANWAGRVRFLVSGELRWFDDRMRARARHITPIAGAQMRGMLDEAGFKRIATAAAGSFSGPLRTLLTAPLSAPFLAFLGRRGWGDCSIYLARKCV